MHLLIGMISLFDYYYCAHKESSVHWSFFVSYVTTAVHDVVQIPIDNKDAMFLFSEILKLLLCSINCFSLYECLYFAYIIW